MFYIGEGHRTTLLLFNFQIDAFSGNKGTIFAFGMFELEEFLYNTIGAVIGYWIIE